MRKRYLEIYRNGYRVCGIDSSSGIHLAEEAFLDTFKEYKSERHSERYNDMKLSAEFEGMTYFTLQEVKDV